MRQCVSWSPSGRGRVGTEIRHSPAFTAAEEQALWAKGVLGCTNPKNLQRAVFFYIGKRFCVRGGEEQRRLGPSQFVRTRDPDCFTYIEHGSKNRSGGLAQLHLENKCVPCYAVPENITECLVFLLDYLHIIPFQIARICFQGRYNLLPT